MASSSRKNNKCMLSEAERPRFYKIILDDTIREKKLGIPRKFVRNYGHHLSSRVSLKVTSGTKWQVDIVRSDGRLWLQNGWPEFADYYSIGHSYFLLFEYEKNNGDFTVIIFDKTATEVDYTFCFSHEPNIIHEAEDDVSLKILEHSSPSIQKKVKSQISLPSSPHKIKPKCSAKTFDPHCPTGEVEGTIKQTIEKESRSNVQKLLFSNLHVAPNPSFQGQITSDCLKRLRMHVPKSFVMNMELGPKATMLEVNNKSWPVTLLIYRDCIRGLLSLGWDAFARDNSLKLGDVCNFEMINSDQPLLIKVSITRDSGIFLASNGDNEMPESQVPKPESCEISRKRKDTLPLSSTWPHKKMKKTGNFSNFTEEDNNTEVKQINGSIPDQKRIAETIEPSNEVTSGNPFFKVVISSSHLEGNKVGVPKKFVRNYGKELSNWVILKVPSGEKWKVDIVKINGELWLAKGWQKFMEYYSIVIGSLLVFQFDENNSSFNVTIFESAGTEIDYPYNFINEVAAEPQVPKDESYDIPVEISWQFSPSRKREEKSPMPSSSWSHKKIKCIDDFTNVTGEGTKKKENQSFQKQMGASSCSQSQNPTFQIKMMPSHVLDRKSTPDIPTSFVRKYMKRRDGDALLNVLDGRTWPVKYSSGVKRTRLMHSGWNKFVKDNYLQVGDVCKFELIDPHKILFRVVISRSTTGGILGSSSKQSLDRKTSCIKTESANVEFF